MRTLESHRAGDECGDAETAREQCCTSDGRDDHIPDVAQFAVAENCIRDEARVKKIDGECKQARIRSGLEFSKSPQSEAARNDDKGRRDGGEQ
jgi:hypothetical protein